MLNDGDKWPVVCVECGHVDPQEIGRLRDIVTFDCTSCGSELSFDNEEFVKLLGNLRRTVDGFARNAMLTKKRR